MQTLVPRRWGGHELGLQTHIEVVQIISAACMSTGWITAFYMGHNWMVTKLSEQAQAEIFADRPFGLIPTTTSPTLAARAVPGGWEISGRAPWGSGIMHADWVVLGGVAAGAGPRLFLMPVADVTVDDTWQMSGMAGTGSNDIVVEALFVPEHRSISLPEFSAGRTAGSAIHPNPLYQVPLLPFIYNEAICVFAGGLRGATNALEEIVNRRVTTHARTVVKDQQYTHVLLGEAHAKAFAAESLVRDLLNQTMDCMAKDGFELDDRLRLKASAAFITEHCRLAVSDMINHAGTSSFHNAEPLQRFFRDINTLATHAFWSWDTSRELYGRHRLGLEPNNPLI